MVVQEVVIALALQHHPRFIAAWEVVIRILEGGSLVVLVSARLKDQVACSAEMSSAKVPLKPNWMHGVAVLLKATSYRYRRYRRLRVSERFEGLDPQIWGKRKKL